MVMSRRHIMLASAALLVSGPVFAAETSSNPIAPVVPARNASVKCQAGPNVPMTKDAEQALPLQLVRTLSCGETVSVLSDAEGYTAHVRSSDGKDGYVALIFLGPAADGFAHSAAVDLQPPSSATPVNGIVRWHAGAPGCERFTSQGHLVESITANGVTVQIALEDTGWKFRTDVAVSNQSDSTLDVFPSLISLDELQPGLKSLRAQDPRKVAHAKEHQVLWTEYSAKPSLSAVFEHRSSASLQNASYHVQDYFAPQPVANAAEAKNAPTLASDDPLVLALKASRLQPGQHTVGVIWFERDPNARELSMRVPVGDMIFDFPLSFDQKR